MKGLVGIIGVFDIFISLDDVWRNTGPMYMGNIPFNRKLYFVKHRVKGIKLYLHNRLFSPRV